MPLTPFTPLRAAVATLLLCATAWAAPARAAEQPFRFEDAYGRLPKDVVPISYSVAITPDAARLTIAGEESVTLEFRQRTGEIRFNSLHQALTDVTLDGRPVAAVKSDDDAQLTTVTLAAPTSIGRHVLRFRYTGRIEEQPQGLFRQRFVTPSGEQGEMLSTQMESIYARMMFPCWDEPAFRARFELTVTAPARWTAVSNMPIASRRVAQGLATTRFRPTPPMPSYLVELTLGDLARISARERGITHSIWAVHGQEQGGVYALANSRQILADYDDYFGVRYPLPKIDSIAIPGGFSGAMENWGAITYNESTLLLTPASTLGERQEVYSTQAHEIAHQWFGDLVTMGWWDNIWLNESFASWMAAKQTDRRNPDWRWWQAQDRDKEGAMEADAIAGVHSILQHITDENLVDNAFDPQITYSKGQAMLRMLEAWLGPDVFRDGVRQYMRARQYSNATSTDLWLALGSAARQDVAAVAADWTEQPGFPLVSVATHCDANSARTIDIAQERFLADGSAGEPGRWAIPLQLRDSAAATSRPLLVRGNARGIAAGRCGDALILNADAIGYYRVKYDDATLVANTRAFARLPAGDRIALLDDQWALASAGRAPLGQYLALVAAMGDELVPRAWEQVAGALEAIEYVERGLDGHDAFTAFARAVLKPVHDRLGMTPRTGEAGDLQRLRRVVNRDLGKWGDAAVLAEARRRFAAFRKERTSVAPDEQRLMLTLVARFADAATFEQLHELARSTRDAAELPRFYGALAEVGDPALAQRAADIALSGEIPPQQNTLPMQMVLGLAGNHQAVAWRNFTANADKLLASQAMFAPMMTAQYLPQTFWPGIPLAEMEAWIRTRVPQNMGPLVERGMDSARIELKRKQTLVREADAYLAAKH